MAANQDTRRSLSHAIAHGRVLLVGCLVVLLATVGADGPAGAIGTASISGLVTEASSGIPVEGATVTAWSSSIVPSKAPESIAAATAADGSYSFEGLEAGSYFVEVSAPGFATGSFPATTGHVRRFSLSGGEASVIADIALLPEGSVRA